MAWYNTPIKWPFTPKAVKTVGGGGGAWLPTVAAPFGESSYDAFAFYGYKRNSTANMCIRLIARAISGLPIKIYRTEIVNGENVEVFIDDHRLHQKIGFDGQPNHEMSWKAFNDAYWAYEFLDGDNYVYAFGDSNLPELWPLRPDRVKPIKAALPWAPVLHYEYKVNGVITILPAEDVMHTKTFDPLNDSTGMPLLEPAMVEIDQANFAGLWNVSLLKRGGRPSLLISVPEGKGPPDKAQQKMIDQWASDNLEGYNKAGNILIGNGMDVKEVGINPKDMDWLKGNVQAKVAIANVCGVPPELIGIQDQKTYSNYETALKAFYEQTIIPLADDYFRSLTRFLGGRYTNERRGQTEGVTIAVNKTDVVALHEAQDSLHKRLRDDKTAGILTTDEVRAEYGFDPVPGGDVILVTASTATLEDVAAADSDDEVMPNIKPPEVEDEEEDEDEDN